MDDPARPAFTRGAALRRRALLLTRKVRPPDSAGTVVEHFQIWREEGLASRASWRDARKVARGRGTPRTPGSGSSDRDNSHLGRGAGNRRAVRAIFTVAPIEWARALRFPAPLPGRERFVSSFQGSPRVRGAPLATFPASLRDDEGNIACKEQGKRSAAPPFPEWPSRPAEAASLG